MIRPTLPALFAAALWTTAFSPALAQGTVKNAETVKKQESAALRTAAATSASGDTQVVASVNGKPITWGQFINRLQQDDPTALPQAMAQVVGARAAQAFSGPSPESKFTITRAEVMEALRQQPPASLGNALTRVIQLEALNQAAAKEGVQPTDAQITAYMDALLKSARASGKIPAGITDDQFLAAQHLTRDHLKQLLLPQVKISLLAKKEVEQKLGHPVGPDDYLEARHILVKVDTAPDAKPEDIKKANDAALAKINQIAADIKSGKKTFEQAAKENSDDPGSKDQGGDLGPFLRDGGFLHGPMVPEFEAAAFSLKPGEISNPVHTQFGYHLIEVEKPAKPLTDAERQQVLDERTGTYMQTLQEHTKVVNNLAPAQAPGGFGPGGAPRQ